MLQVLFKTIYYILCSTYKHILCIDLRPPPWKNSLIKSAGKVSKMAEDKERESLSDLLNDSEVNEDEEEVTAAEVLNRLEQV